MRERNPLDGADKSTTPVSVSSPADADKPYRLVAVTGTILALLGAVVLTGGLVYLRLALLPSNRTNEFSDIAIAVGAVVSILGAMPLLSGIFLLVVARRRRAKAAAREWHLRRLPG